MTHDLTQFSVALIILINFSTNSSTLYLVSLPFLSLPHLTIQHYPSVRMIDSLTERVNLKDAILSVLKLRQREQHRILGHSK